MSAWEVWVVDNASSDGTAVAVEEAFPEVKTIRNEIRQGFSTNNNLLLGGGLGRYLMLLNDDTLIPGCAARSRLAEPLPHLVDLLSVVCWRAR